MSGSYADQSELGDSALVLEAIKLLRDSEKSVVFVLDQVSRRFLGLSGPCEDFFNLTREQMLADSDAWFKSLEDLDSASETTLQADLNRYGTVVRVIRAVGLDGVKRTLRAALMLRKFGARTLLSGSVKEVEPGSLNSGEPSVLKAAVEEAHEGVAVTDSEGCFIYLNREHVTLFGYDSMEELIGKSWRILYSDDVVRQFEQTVYPELVAKRKWRGRLQAKKKDGSAFLELLSLSLLEGGGIVCSCLDVSDQVALTERLERSEAMFRLFLNTLPTGVTIRNLDGEYEFVNQAALSILGRDVQQVGAQVVGMENCLEDANVFGYWAAVDNRVAHTGTAERFDFPLTHGGRAFVLNVEKLPMRIGSTSVTHVCTLAADVTEERRMQAQMEETARRRDEYLVMQREFVSMVSHEFRTPLTAIQGLQYLMSKSVTSAAPPSSGDLRRWLDLQGQALATLKELVDQVLLLNRIEHLASAVPKRVEIGDFLSKLMDGIAGSMVNPRILIEINTPAGFTALIHEAHMRALVENLVSNALKYSSGSVSVLVSADEDYWRLSVSDSGRGIPQKDQKKLFAPFFRAGNIGNVTGTGLGLTIVQRCSAFHGGKVEFVSQEGKGTIFTVKFPREFTQTHSTLPFTERVPSSESAR